MNKMDRTEIVNDGGAAQGNIIMDIKRAEEILGKEDVTYFANSNGLADLHGEHTAEELEAIAFVMRIAAVHE